MYLVDALWLMVPHSSFLISSPELSVWFTFFTLCMCVYYMYSTLCQRYRPHFTWKTFKPFNFTNIPRKFLHSKIYYTHISKKKKYRSKAEKNTEQTVVSFIHSNNNVIKLHLVSSFIAIEFQSYFRPNFFFCWTLLFEALERMCICAEGSLFFFYLDCGSQNNSISFCSSKGSWNVQFSHASASFMFENQRPCQS